MKNIYTALFIFLVASPCFAASPSWSQYSTDDAGNNLFGGENVSIQCFSYNSKTLLKTFVKSFSAKWINPNSSSDSNMMLTGFLTNGAPVAASCERLIVEELTAAEVAKANAGVMEIKRNAGAISIFGGKNVEVVCYSTTDAVILTGKFSKYSAKWLNPNSSDDANMLVTVTNAAGLSKYASCARIVLRGLGD